MTVYDFKLEVVWVQKAISYQSNKVYSVISASLLILQMVRIEFDSLFRALSLHWFLSNWLIWWFTRFTPFPFTIITPSIWYWVPLSLFIYTFWALIIRVPKPVKSIPKAPPLISCRIAYMSNFSYSDYLNFEMRRNYMTFLYVHICAYFVYIVVH